MFKSTTVDPILDSFLEFLKEHKYEYVSIPLNMRHAAMYEAYKAGVEYKSKS